MEGAHRLLWVFQARVGKPDWKQGHLSRDLQDQEDSNSKGGGCMGIVQMEISSHKVRVSGLQVFPISSGYFQGGSWGPGRGVACPCPHCQVCQALSYGFPLPQVPRDPALLWRSGGWGGAPGQSWRTE